MELVFLIYGMAFFLLGFAILYYPKKNSAFRLAKEINFVGWFGIIHGINEWLDMLIVGRVMDAVFLWQLLRMFTLPLSFIALVYFGSNVIAAYKKTCVAAKLITPVLVIIWGILLLRGGQNAPYGDIVSRYILCFPGAFLAGISLLMYVPEIESSTGDRLTLNLRIAGAAFIAYGCFSGLVVPDAAFFPASFLNYSLFADTVGVPVQVLRTICAVVIAYNLIRVLQLFNLEMQMSLFESHMRFRTVLNTVPVTLFMEDKNQRLTFLEGQRLAGVDLPWALAVGRPASEVFASLPQLCQCSRDAFARGEEIKDVISHEGRYYETFLVPLKDERGKVYGTTGVLVDVTEQRNATQEVNQYRLEMEKNKALAAVGVLSAEIANELAGPLHQTKVSLVKALGGLRRTIGATDIKACIQDGLERIAKTIDSLNGFCAKANLQTSPQPEPIDLFEVVNRVMTVFRDSMQQTMVRIVPEGTDVFPVLRISSREFEQILYILVQQVIQSGDASHLHHASLSFFMREGMLCVDLFEQCGCQAVQQNKALLNTAPDMHVAQDQGFEFSVLKGMIAGYAGTIDRIPHPEGILYQIKLPLAEGL